MVTGQEIGRLARQLYEGGVLIQVSPTDHEQAVAETERLIGSGAETLFEAAFQADDLVVRCDILSKVGGSWDLVEVKSSTKIKDEHVEDIAFQALVLQRAGISVGRLFLCHLDSSQERGEAPVPPSQLFHLEDVTDGARALLPQVEDWAKEFYRIAEGQLEPDVRTNLHCVSPSRCPFYEHCHVQRPEHDIVTLPSIRAKAVTEFREQGYESILDIPEEAKMQPLQRRAWEVVRFDRPHIGKGLAHALSAIQFPAHFIDFEAVAPAIPLFPGTRPYQTLPFQWSDHQLSHPGAEPDHAEFLHTAPGDPRAAFADSLLQRIRSAATVVFYSSYELTTVRGLAASAVPGADELVEILESRGFDLYKLVKDEVYHADFRGSFSIKKVLPALVPELSYDGLEIKDGDTAAVEYLRMHAPGTVDAESKKIAQNLLTYCKLDTLAMVELYRALSELANTRK